MSDRTRQIKRWKPKSLAHSGFIAVAAIYLILVLCGRIPEQSRLESAEMGLLVFVIIMTSSLIDSLSDVSFGNVKARFRKVEERQDRQESEIRSLQVAFNGIVTKYEYDKLIGLSKEAPFLCYYSGDLISELKRLRSMAFIANHEGAGVRSIVREFKDRDEKFDLKRFFFITDAGREYVRLREEMVTETTGDNVVEE